MKLTAEQIRQAMLNHQAPPRTLAAKIRDAVQHVHASEKKPAATGMANGQMMITKESSDYGTTP